MAREIKDMKSNDIFYSVIIIALLIFVCWGLWLASQSRTPDERVVTKCLEHYIPKLCLEIGEGFKQP